ELIKCLDGIGAERKDAKKGFWRVTTESLTRAIVLAMNRRKLSCGKGGEFNFNSVIHLTPDPARSVARISCDPIEALEFGNLSMPKLGRVPYTRTPIKDIWEHEVETGTYEVAVTFSQGQHQDLTQPGEIVFPPEHDCTLKVLL